MAIDDYADFVKQPSSLDNHDGAVVRGGAGRIGLHRTLVSSFAQCFGKPVPVLRA
jgi:hypothetical protein